MTIEERVRHLLERRPHVESWSTAEVWRILRVPHHERTTAATRRIARCLRDAGFTDRVQVREGTARVWRLARPIGDATVTDTSTTGVDDGQVREAVTLLRRIRRQVRSVGVLQRRLGLDWSVTMASVDRWLAGRGVGRDVDNTPP